MPPKKDPPKTRTPRIRAFKVVDAQPSKKRQDADEEEDPLKDVAEAKPTRVILTANAALAREREKKKQEKAQSSEDTKAAKKPATQSSSDKKTKPPKTEAKAQSASETSEDINTRKKNAKAPKDKQKPSTSGTAQPPPPKSKPPKVKLPKNYKNQASKSKTDKKTVTKAGKPATSKQSVGNQPYQQDSASETPAPEDEPDNFASSDEDPRQQQIEMDEAMAQALAEDADDSPLDLNWSKRKYTPSEDEAIIDHVKANQIYYNMRRTDFKEKATKDDLWRPLEIRFKVPGK